MRLEAKNLSFSYKKGGTPLYQNFDFAAESCERVGLLAPSGFGKTTLCRLLSGYLRPDKGEILLGGKPLPKRGYCPVQMIWQHPEKAVDPHLRMAKTLEEGGTIPQRTMEALGIEPGWLERFPGELSGGELQRFCIARALGEGTRFLIADEISTMLDLITQSQIWRFLIEETSSRNIGLIAVSHSESLLHEVCDRIEMLDVQTSEAART